MRVVWSERATAQAREIFDYIGEIAVLSVRHTRMGPEDEVPSP